MTSPLLTTKLDIPPVRQALVLRLRLMERLDASLASRLTLIAAPAGFGKTTLISAWIAAPDHARQRKGQAAWISLDEEDSDPAQFFAYLVAALQRVDGAIGQGLMPLLEAPQLPPPTDLTTLLVNDISRSCARMVLVLDDYHLVTNLQVHQAVQFLIEHQPANLHLVIGTREDPPLPLPRLRARGQVVEVRERDLRFTSDEATHFLQETMGLRLSDEAVAALGARTEGWAAGLQLAALALQSPQSETPEPEGERKAGASIAAMVGNNRYIADYLLTEVLERQTQRVQDFMLQTAILSRLTASLCDAVVYPDAPPGESARLLQYLEQANLFLVPLDYQRTWFRYHHLFAELLRGRLRLAQDQEAVISLHRRASAWFAAHDLTNEAVQHAQWAADWPLAAHLITSHAVDLFKAGQVMQLVRWMRQMPEEAVRQNPTLCHDYGWSHLLTGQVDKAEPYLLLAEQGLEEQPAALGDTLAGLAFVARARGQMEHALDLAQRGLDVIPKVGAEDERATTLLGLGLAHWSLGHYAACEAAMLESSHEGTRSASTQIVITSTVHLARVHALRLEFDAARTLYEQAIHMGGRQTPVPASAIAFADLAAYSYELGDLVRAHEYATQSVQLGELSGHAEHRALAYRLVARVTQARGDTQAALDALCAVHRLADEHNLSVFTRSLNAACHAELALVQNDLETAVRYVAQIAHDTSWDPVNASPRLVAVRLLLAQGYAGEAEKLLLALAESASGFGYALLRVRLLQALATWAAGRAPREQAYAHLIEALSLAQPVGARRCFLDLGTPLTRLLAETRPRIPRPELATYADSLLGAFRLAGAPEGAGDEASPRAEGLLEPLSDRELEVLRLLVAGLSNNEIATRLYIAVGTAKTHINHIFGKLGVATRTQAIARARELGLS